MSRRELAVSVPPEMERAFRAAQVKVRRYFEHRVESPLEGRLTLGGDRHLLMRGDVLSFEFSQTIRGIYGNGRQAHEIFLSLMFDVAHAAGASDARKFHEEMQLTDPLDKLSVGPIYFAHTGFARVTIHAHSKPVPDDDFVLFYRHENSFEDESWRAHGGQALSPVCIVSAGYSSGWCSESFGMPLIAVEYECGALGDRHCEFVMAPPHRLESHLPSSIGERRHHLHTPRFFGRQEHEQQLRRLAYQDVLTGLANRTMFRELAEQTMKIAHRQGNALGLLFLDLDGFKDVNDVHGHAAGDAVLVEVAARMRVRLRQSDIACRLGGDEFSVLLSDLGSATNMRSVVAELMRAINEPIDFDGTTLQVGVSVGALFEASPGRRSFDTMMGRADALMYEAKRRGKNRTVFAEE